MSKTKITNEEVLAFHHEPTPGKWEVQASVPMTTQRDLSLAYSPGVAVPCEAITENVDGDLERGSGAGSGEFGRVRVEAGDGGEVGSLLNGLPR